MRADETPARHLVRVGEEGQVASALFGGKRLAVIGGPCVLESWSVAARVAESLKETCSRLNLPYVFKASYRKANRSSGSSYRGPGIDQGLLLLARIKSEFGIPVLTDIHETSEAGVAGQVADALQIPAFLCRQTDLIEAAARTGRALNIKKGQFLSPSEMEWAVDKAAQVGSGGILLTERGHSFGYGDLVVDMRSFPVMAATGWPTIFDITHSLQQPGGRVTGGRRQFAAPQTAGGVFLEAHPDPDNALSDSATMLSLEQVVPILESLVAVREALSSTQPFL